jgi:hypothetical protein
MHSANITKRLSTGQTISLTGPEEKQLRNAFDFIAGYNKRTQLKLTIAQKAKVFSQFNDIGKLFVLFIYLCCL